MEIDTNRSSQWLHSGQHNFGMPRRGSSGGQKITPESRLMGERIDHTMKIARDGPINQAELARRMGIKSARLGNYIQGTRHLSIHLAKRIQAVTGVPAAYVLGLVDERDMELLRAPDAVKKALAELLRSSGASAPTPGEDPFQSRTPGVARFRAG